MFLDRLFATVYDPVTSLIEPRIAPHRQYLTAGLSGRVLDLGTGTGRLFPYFDANGDDLVVDAIDPDERMLARARRRAAKATVEIECRSGRAEQLPYDDDRFEAVVSSLVLCSVDDQRAALDEIERVLAPGGEFRLVEHVGADGWTGSAQTLVEPLWRRLAGNCHLTRPTEKRVAARNELDVLELERIDPGFPLVRPFVRGRFRRRR